MDMDDEERKIRWTRSAANRRRCSYFADLTLIGFERNAKRIWCSGGSRCRTTFFNIMTKHLVDPGAVSVLGTHDTMMRPTESRKL